MNPSNHPDNGWGFVPISDEQATLVKLSASPAQLPIVVGCLAQGYSVPGFEANSQFWLMLRLKTCSKFCSAIEEQNLKAFNSQGENSCEC